MSHPEVPDTVRALIAERIDTIPELEALLLLRQTREQSWSADEAGQRLYVSPAVAAHILSAMTERGLFKRVLGRYQYGPETNELDASVALLAECYSKQLIAVTNIVHAKPSAGVRLFAEAFRLRKDK